MNMTTKACQIALLRDDNYPVSVAHCCCYSLFIERRKCAKIDNFYCTTHPVDNVNRPRCCIW